MLNIVLCFQVRIGTARGAQVVKLAIITLYVLTFALGLSSALPFTCIVSNQFMAISFWTENKIAISDYLFCHQTTSES